MAVLCHSDWVAVLQEAATVIAAKHLEVSINGDGVQDLLQHVAATSLQLHLRQTIRQGKTSQCAMVNHLNELKRWLFAVAPAVLM